MSELIEKRYYAPWKLKGDGYIVLYKLPKSFLIKNTFITDYFKNKLFVGLSALMIIDYKDSDVGTYQEILFIPGVFNFKAKKHFSISKIYVNSKLSEKNGYENWAIPKEYADFKITKNKSVEIVEISNENKFFKAQLKNSFLKIPFSNKFFPLSLVQHKNEQTFVTEFYASGFLSKANIKIDFVNNKDFPELNQFKPLMAFKINNFEMVFKEAKIFDY